MEYSKIANVCSFATSQKQSRIFQISSFNVSTMFQHNARFVYKLTDFLNGPLTF